MIINGTKPEMTEDLDKALNEKVEELLKEEEPKTEESK